MEPTLSLSKEQIEFFAENGYLKITNITTPEEVARIRLIYDKLFEDRRDLDRGLSFDLAGESEERPTLPQILAPSNLAPELRETLLWANAGASMKQLFGRELSGQGDHAILKPAQYGAPTPWHQDESYWDPGYEHFSMSVWAPLQDVDEASGCLHFVPGSHRLEVLPHRPIGNNPKTHGLELDGELPAGSRVVGVPLKVGEATVHHQRMLHYAPGNHTDVPRRAYIVMGSLPGNKLPNARVFAWQEAQKKAGAPAS